ncbi:4774_t:CDS:10 [Paraglomus brasilianum]|uniref:4774_t:CDS:1 n=1 Tax=Paraglomus brasilianum TaxID=144538 RepID=A0A9N9CLD4_9GLOM|nr:4774_t:CDS:10 [Paraglomus brasilianum]
MPRKKNEQTLDSKFKVIDGRRYQALDDSNYFLPNDENEEERLDVQHIVMKQAFDGNFSAPVDQLLRKGARVLDVCCGSCVWTLELAKEYPNSYFIGIDIAPVVLPVEKPSNLEFVEYNVLDGLPFDDNSFDYVFARYCLAVYTRSQWTKLAIPEYTRITKPGGWVEMMEIDLIRGGDKCENVTRLNNAWIALAESKNFVVIPAFEIRGFLEQSGCYTNIDHKEVPVPVGPKGDKYAEMAIRNFRDLWSGLKYPYVAVMQITGEHYDAILESAIKELIEYGIFWKNVRAWGQKKDYTRSTTESQDKPILTELIYGRTRIFTALAPASTHSPTSSKSTPQASSSPLLWQWEPQKSNSGVPEVRSPVSSFIGSIKQSLSAMFLPVGYPETVHECYAKFHIWLAAETFIGSSTGVLCSQAMLSSLGLGQAEAAAGAVAIQWVLKDGFGEIGKLFFIKRFAYSFDSHPKTWRMISETFAVVGYFLQLCTCIAKPSLFLPLASLGNAFESIQYSIFGATHMAFTRNFALSGNIGDIVAKDDAQMSFAHLLGMLCGVGLITISHDPAFLFSCFAVLVPANLYATLSLLKAAQFEILNQAKLSLIAKQYIDTGEVPTMDELKDREIGFGEWIKPGKSPIGVKVRLGGPASDAFRRSGDIQRSLSVLSNENYLFNYHQKRNVIDILYHSDAESNDIIKSVLHVLKFYDSLAAKVLANKEKIDDERFVKLVHESHGWTNENFGKFVADLDDKDWQSDVVFWKDR